MTDVMQRRSRHAVMFVYTQTRPIGAGRHAVMHLEYESLHRFRMSSFLREGPHMREHAND